METNWLDKWQGKLRTEDDCVRFVEDVGFCTIDTPERFPEFPNQADAMELESAIGETWFWKDDLHTQKRLFYTRLFFNKPGYISLALLPAFIATNGQVADELILMGRMSVAQRTIYEVIDKYGPIPTKELKKSLTPEVTKQSSTALIVLERMFIVTKVEITGRTRGTYGYVWDLAERWVPRAFEESDRLGAARARELILEKLRMDGVSDSRELVRAAFGWE